MTNSGPQYQPQQPGYVPPGPGQPYPPQEPPKKKRGGCMKWGAIVVGVLILIAIIASIAGGGDDDTEGTGETATSQPEAPATDETGSAAEPASEPEQSPQNSGLRWEAETSGGTPMDITYVGENFNITQQQDQASPWTATIDVDSRMDVMGANMSAQNNGGGNVTCRVYWDGELVNENTSSGEFAIATCSLPM